MYSTLFFACVLIVGCAILPAIGQGMGYIPGVNCTQKDVVNMMGRCMLKFTRGHSAPVIAKMRKSLTCDGKLINCNVVMETRLCLADLAARELSQPCKPFIDRVADYQFGDPTSSCATVGTALEVIGTRTPLYNCKVETRQRGCVFNIPCRVSHLRDTCRDFFFQHNMTQF